MTTFHIIPPWSANLLRIPHLGIRADTGGWSGEIAHSVPRLGLTRTRCAPQNESGCGARLFNAHVMLCFPPNLGETSVIKQSEANHFNIFQSFPFKLLPVKCAVFKSKKFRFDKDSAQQNDATSSRFGSLLVAAGRAPPVGRAIPALPQTAAGPSLTSGRYRKVMDPAVPRRRGMDLRLCGHADGLQLQGLLSLQLAEQGLEPP